MKKTKPQWKRRKMTGLELLGHEEKVLRMNQEGLSAKKIGAQFGAPPHIVRRFLKASGVELHNGPASTLLPHKDQIVAMYSDERLTIDVIGEKFGVDGTAVWKFLKKQGVEMRERRQLQVSQIPEIDRLYNVEGLDIASIAKHLGVTYAPLYRFMKKNGLETRGHGEHAKGVGNGRWMGGAATYNALHERIRKLRGTPSKCEQCGTSDPNKNYQWASQTENYNDVDDYKRMCVSCHKKHDNQKRRNRFKLTTASERWNMKIRTVDGALRRLADFSLQEALDWIAHHAPNNQK